MNREHAEEIVKALDDKTREAIAAMVGNAKICYDAHQHSDAYQTLQLLAAEIRGEGSE